MQRGILMASNTYWSQTELAHLREVYPAIPNSKVVDLFPGRTLKGIIFQASKMGVKKKAEYREQGMEFNGSIIGHLSEPEKGYLAGIIDGEGTIGFSRRKYKDRYVYFPRVSIANTSKTLIAWIAEKLPSFNSYVSSREGSLGKKTCYCIILTGNRQCTVFLRELTPYLLIKRELAEIVANGYLHLDDVGRDAMYQECRKIRAS